MRVEEAAEALGVTPHRLVAWSARFGHPSFTEQEGERIYDPAEIRALREALATTSSIPAAMATASARRRDDTPATRCEDASTARREHSPSRHRHE